MRKMLSFEHCEFCEFFCYASYYISIQRYRFSVRSTKSIQNSQASPDYIFHSLQYFTIKLHNFTHFWMLFRDVLIKCSNFRVSLIGNWLILSQCLLVFFSLHSVPSLSSEIEARFCDHQSSCDQIPN